MKTFDDLKFGPHPNNDFRPGYGRGCLLVFDNGWGVSVVQNYEGMTGLYGNLSDNTFELAVLAPDGDLHYYNPVARGDVCAYLSPEEVTSAMVEVQGFPSDQKAVPAEWRKFSPRHYDRDFPRPVLAI